MITLLFLAIAATWGSLALYFAWGFFSRKPSPPEFIVIAFAFLWGPVHIARELKWLPRLPTGFFLAAALTIGVLGVLIVWQHEAQKRRPFR